MKCVKAPSLDRGFIPKCKVKICPNQVYNATGIYISKYCEDHLDLDKNLVPLNPKQAENYYKKHDSKQKKIREAFKIKRIVDRISKRHGIGCDCGFCECLRVEMTK